MSRPTPQVLDRVKNPRHCGKLEHANAVGRADLDGQAPRYVIYLRVENNILAECSFQVFGCGYSVASASMLMELAAGQHIDEARSLTAKLIEDSLGGLPVNKRFCSQMAVDAIQDAIANYQASS